MGIFSKFKSAILSSLSFNKIDEELFEELEESLILSDVGMAVATEAVEELRKRVRKEKIETEEALKAALRDILEGYLNVGDPAIDVSTKPSVVLFIGVNGVGKTTSIGKIAHRMKSEGKKVILCAGDTFRAAAADQLEIWSQRAGVDIVRQNEGTDPGAVLFDALAAAKARNCDVVLCDTAGRLHNKQNLMNELAKMRKIIDREVPDSVCETLLVLDATTGQGTSELSRDMMRQELTVNGTRNLLTCNELDTQDILEFMEHQEDVIMPLLNDTFNGIHVMFSEEASGSAQNDTFVIGNSSMIVGRYHKDGRDAGGLGIIGPMRLDYAKVIPYLEYFTQKITDLISEKEDDDI